NMSSRGTPRDLGVYRRPRFLGVPRNDNLPPDLHHSCGRGFCGMMIYAAPVSVLMPVYNAERYVAAAVQSILDQTMRDFEFVIVNDGSTDHSLRILKAFAKKDRRIHLISRGNTGLVGALTDGLNACRGEFIARM